MRENISLIEIRDVLQRHNMLPEIGRDKRYKLYGWEFGGFRAEYCIASDARPSYFMLEYWDGVAEEGGTVKIENDGIIGHSIDVLSKFENLTFKNEFTFVGNDISVSVDEGHIFALSKSFR